MNDVISEALIELAAYRALATFADILNALPPAIGAAALGRAIGYQEAALELSTTRAAKPELLEAFEKAKAAGRLSCRESWEKNKNSIDAICASFKK